MKTKQDIQASIADVEKEIAATNKLIDQADNELTFDIRRVIKDRLTQRLNVLKWVLGDD